MEGLYPSSLYSSSSYMMQHSDHTPYYPSYRPSNSSNSAFSDARSYMSHPMPPPLAKTLPSTATSNVSALSHSSLAHPSTTTSMSTSSSSSVLGWSSSALPWTNAPPMHHTVRSSSSCFPLTSPMQRPKLTTTVWEDENTVCYQVDAKSVCVARRQDNDMINGTKLLNVVGMSRGKRDGILKNEKGRVVVKVGAMHLKGVWITFERAKDLAAKFKIEDLLYPLFTDDPSIYLCPSTIPGTNMPSSTLLPPSTSGSAHANHLTTMVVPSRIPPSLPYKHDPYAFSMPTWDRPTSDTHETLDHQDSFTNILRGNPSESADLPSGSCSPVPGTIAPLMPPPTSTIHPHTTSGIATSTIAPTSAPAHDDLYLMNSPYDYRHPTTMSLPPRTSSSAAVDAFDYDPLSRKSYMKHASPSDPNAAPAPAPAYPHSPPHEDIKYNPLSHHTPPPAQPWQSAYPLPPPLTIKHANNKQDLTSVPPHVPSIPPQRGQKRSLQQTIPTDLPEIPHLPADAKPVKKLRTQH